MAVLTYALSRYSPIIQFFILVRSTRPMSETECHVNNVIQAAAGLLSILSPTIFSTLRVYALSGGHQVLTAVAFLFCCVPFGINAMNEVGFVEAVNMHAPFNCSGRQTMPKHLLYGVTIASRTCLIVGDLIVLLVTWMNTYTAYRAKRGVYDGPSILQVMLCNGCFCFIIITSMNTAQMVIAPMQFQSVLNICGYVNLFITPITSLLICHFLLDLHQAGHVPGASTSSPTTDISPVQFAARRSSASLSTLSSSTDSLDDPLQRGEYIVSGVEHLG